MKSIIRTTIFIFIICIGPILWFSKVKINQFWLWEGVSFPYSTYCTEYFLWSKQYRKDVQQQVYQSRYLNIYYARNNFIALKMYEHPFLMGANRTIHYTYWHLKQQDLIFRTLIAKWLKWANCYHRNSATCYQHTSHCLENLEAGKM